MERCTPPKERHKIIKPAVQRCTGARTCAGAAVMCVSILLCDRWQPQTLICIMHPSAVDPGHWTSSMIGVWKNCLSWLRNMQHQQISYILLAGGFFLAGDYSMLWAYALGQGCLTACRHIIQVS